MSSIVSIDQLSKIYDNGHKALDNVSLEIRDGEILALLGPNGAGKTSMISIICGIVTPSSGQVRVGGHDIINDYRSSRALIGLVPQDIALEPFETVYNTVQFSRGLFGKPKDPQYIERILRQLSLWDKAREPMMNLSGGNQQKVVLSKWLFAEPEVLILDEPTRGIDVGAKFEIYGIINELSAMGKGVVMISSEMPELLGMCDRIYVMNEGALVGELTAEEASQERIMSLIVTE